MANKPLTADEIERLPTEKFQRRATKNEEDNKCNICWDEFEQDQPLRRLRCLHLYHKDCIDPWLKVNLILSYKKLDLILKKFRRIVHVQFVVYQRNE